MCGCGGPKEIVVIKKRKRQPAVKAAAPKSVVPKKNVVVKIQLQVQKQDRDKNRKLATQMAAKGRRQLAQKYPLQQSVLTAPKHKGIFFPPKQETQRITNRQKVNKQVAELMKQIQKQHKESSTKWQKTQSGWNKKK